MIFGDKYKSAIDSVLGKKLPHPSFKGKKVAWELVAREVTKHAHKYAYRVPHGYSYLDVEKQIDALYAACGNLIELKDRAGVVEIHVLLHDLPKIIKYSPEHLKITEGDKILIGFNRVGEPVIHDFKIPHQLVAGQPGYGKTDYIRFMILQLISRFSPGELEIHIIDMKGFSFLPFIGLPHVTKEEFTLEGAVEVLEDALRLMESRRDVVREHGSRDVIKNFKWRIVVIDEAASISPNMQSEEKAKKMAKKASQLAGEISRIGREPKVGLIFATQYPTAEVIHGQIRQGMESVVCFKTENSTHSNVALGASGAEMINTEGRAFYKSKTGLVLVQVPYVGDDDAWKEVLKPYVTGGNASGTPSMAHVETSSGHDSTGGERAVQLEWIPSETSEYDFD